VVRHEREVGVPLAPADLVHAGDEEVVETGGPDECRSGRGW
jgi:hypothetical protein